MKISNKLMLLLLVVLLLSGCALPEECGYAYVEKGNDSYLILDSDSLSNNSQLSSSDIAPYVSFSSMAEMKSDIKNGYFTEKETLSISRFAKDTKGHIKVCSIDNLYEPKVPDGCTAEITKLIWAGEHYTFWVNARSSFHAEISLRPRKDVTSEIETQFVNARYVTEHSQTESYNVAPNVVATAYYFFYNSSCKYVHYSFEQDGTKYYVQEIHDYPSRKGKVEAIQIWGVNDTYSFSAWITPPTSGPAMLIQNWQGIPFYNIAQIGLKKYVETEIS